MKTPTLLALAFLGCGTGAVTTYLAIGHAESEGRLRAQDQLATPAGPSEAALVARIDALAEVRDTGSYTGMTGEEMVAARQSVEDLIGLEAFYEIEEQTVEERKWGKR